MCERCLIYFVKAEIKISNYLFFMCFSGCCVGRGGKGEGKGRVGGGGGVGGGGRALRPPPPPPPAPRSLKSTSAYYLLSSSRTS